MAISLTLYILYASVLLHSFSTGLPDSFSPFPSSLDKASPFPLFLNDGNIPLPNGYPWGAATTEGINPYTKTPNTGVVRKYTFTVTRGYTIADGVNKSALLVNNEFPGPLIEANWGDTFQITVHNQLTGPNSEGTLLHWHGLLQRSSPWFDGVPSVDMCPIAPGKSFTSYFRADLFGTSWWHSHYDAQYADGLFGPMIIYGPNNVDYDIDLGPVLLGPYYHSDYKTYVQYTSGIPFRIPIADNNLINGKTFYNCSLAASNGTCTPGNSAISKFQFTTGKTHRLRLVNAGADGIQRFSIDNHVMTVIANDFTPVVPYETDVVTLGVGQRTDVLVKAIGKATDAVWMRSNFSVFCGIISQPYGLAAIYYPKADKNMVPMSTAAPYTETSCGNDPLANTRPVSPITPPQAPATTQELEIDLGVNSSGNALFFVNGISFRGNYDNPVLLLAKMGNISYPDDPQWNVYNFGTNSSVRIVITNKTNLTHPMHLHGHVPWILAEGVGTWDGTVTNPTNPQRRDVQLLQGNGGYVVMEFLSDNPGVWPLHCHIAWHVSTGLYISVLELPDKIKELDMPSTVAQTCRDWAHYTGHTVVDQIDSGL